MHTPSDRLARAIALFDAANAKAPGKEMFEGTGYPREVLYAQRMSAWLDKFAPGASEVLKLAARAQHIRRWAIPRSEYPMDRKGYDLWRTTLAPLFPPNLLEEVKQAIGAA